MQVFGIFSAFFVLKSGLFPLKHALKSGLFPFSRRGVVVRGVARSGYR